MTADRKKPRSSAAVKLRERIRALKAQLARLERQAKKAAKKPTKAAKKPAAKPTKKPTKVAKKPAAKAAKKPAAKPTKVARKPAAKPAKKPVAKPAKKPAAKAAKKPVAKAAKKPAAKAAKTKRTTAKRLSASDRVEIKLAASIALWDGAMAELGWSSWIARVAQNADGSVDAELSYALVNEMDADTAWESVDGLLRDLAITALDVVLAANRDKYVWISGAIQRAAQFDVQDTTGKKLYSAGKKLESATNWQRYPQNTVIPTMRKIMAPAMAEYWQEPSSVHLLLTWRPDKRRPERLFEDN